jgi:hypothetical protein
MTTERNGSVLTDTDKARIREEMVLRDEVRREIAAAQAKEPRSGLYSFLNSRFFISVVAGFALTLMPKLLLDARERRDRATATENAFREKRLGLLSSAVNDLSRYVSLKASWRQLRIWLDQHPDGTAELNGMPRAEVHATYHDFYKRLMDVRRPDAALAEVRSFFTATAVLSRADEFEKAVDRIGHATTDQELTDLVSKQNAIRDQLFRAMAEEAKQPAP